MKQKPKLGQNFLIDPAACVAIADALGDVSRKTVVEIGPGTGAITEILAPRAHRLVAIELIVISHPICAPNSRRLK